MITESVSNQWFNESKNDPRKISRLNNLFGGCPSGLPLANYLALSAWVHIFPDARLFTFVHTHLLAKMDSNIRVLGSWQDVLCSDAPPFSDPWGTFLRMCSSGGLLGLKNEKNVISLSFIRAGHSSSLLPPLSLSQSICPQGTVAQPGTLDSWWTYEWVAPWMEAPISFDWSDSPSSCKWGISM